MSALFPAAPDAFGADELLRLRRETPAWGSYAHFAHGSASLPPQFTKMISRYDHDEQTLFDAGIEYAVTQIRDLITGGADGIHLYAMNNARVARLVYEGIRDLLPERT